MRCGYKSGGRRSSRRRMGDRLYPFQGLGGREKGWGFELRSGGFNSRAAIEENSAEVHDRGTYDEEQSLSTTLTLSWQHGKFGRGEIWC